MEQVINHVFVIDEREYEIKISRESIGFLKSECHVTIFAPTEPHKANWQEMFFNEVMLEKDGVWRFVNTKLPQRIISLEDRLTSVINQLTSY